MIHKSAIIGKKVHLGKDVKIGPFCVVDNGAAIGNNVELKSHVITEGKVIIGEGTRIYPFVSLCYPQTLKYKGEDSKIVIGKNNIIREHVTIQHGTHEGKMVTSIGNNCLFMVGAHIAHNCLVGNNVILANYASLAGHVEVGDFAILGGLSAVQQFCRIGSHAMVGGLSAVTRDLVPYGLASNDRAHLLGLNLVGMNRRGFNKKDSIEAHQAVKEIFSNTLDIVLNKRIEYVKIKYPNNQIIIDIVNFLEKDKFRAFCRYK